MQGEIAVVIGPNGAGRSTLFVLHSGVSTPDGGRVLIGGTDAVGLPAHRGAQLGLACTFQFSRELGRLAVLGNLLLAAPDATGDARSSCGPAP